MDVDQACDMMNIILSKSSCRKPIALKFIEQRHRKEALFDGEKCEPQIFRGIEFSKRGTEMREERNYERT